jgi:hypothetical protein
MYLGDSCSGEPVHFFLFGYEKVANLNMSGSSACSPWVTGSGDSGFGQMFITGAYSYKGTSAYTIAVNYFTDDKCTLESFYGTDATVVSGECTKIGTKFSYTSSSYHDKAPQLPANKMFLVEGYYDSLSTCLADNTPENYMIDFSAARAFTLDVCIPISETMSGMYTTDKKLHYYSTYDCTGAPTATVSSLTEEKCTHTATTGTYPGGFKDTLARSNQYYYKNYVTRTAKKGKTGKSSPKAKAKE